MPRCYTRRDSVVTCMIPLPLRAALTRGAWVTATAWPVVFIDFVLDTGLKLALAVPALGGGLVMAALVAPDLGGLMTEGPGAALEAIVHSLATRPIALASFITAIAVVGLAGAPLVFALKAGTLAVLVAAERTAPRPRYDGTTWHEVRHATGFHLRYVVNGIRTFWRRAAVLALGLGVAYLVIAAAYVLTVGASAPRPSAVDEPTTPWPAIVFGATSAGVVLLWFLHLLHDLLRIVVVTDDCRVSVAVGRLSRFLVARARQVLGILCVMGAARIVAGTASLLAAAGLGVMAWLPVVGLAFLPLQAAAWLLRGLLLQYMQSATLVAYQTQYRRLSAQRWGRSAPDEPANYLFGDGTAAGFRR